MCKCVCVCIQTYMAFMGYICVLACMIECVIVNKLNMFKVIFESDACEFLCSCYMFHCVLNVRFVFISCY